MIRIVDPMPASLVMLWMWVNIFEELLYVRKHNILFEIFK